MYSNHSITRLIMISAMLYLSACTEEQQTSQLAGLLALAGNGVVDIQFAPDSSEDVISINSHADYIVEGVRSDGTAAADMSHMVDWSITPGAFSTIDQNGRLTTAGQAEMVTLTATFEHLTTSFDVGISDSKFDKVTQLNETLVEVGMCEHRSIVPYGRYVYVDGTEETRRVDVADLVGIEWIIKNREDGSASQRARVKFDSGSVSLQGYAAGDVLIEARSISKHSNTTVSSDDFEQSIGNNINSVGICKASAVNLSACARDDFEVRVDDTINLIAVANIQDGLVTRYENVTQFAKWGNNDDENIGLDFAADKQSTVVSGIVLNSSVAVSAACGEVDQFVFDGELDSGVVLDETATCDNPSASCVNTVASVLVVAEEDDGGHD